MVRINYTHVEYNVQCLCCDDCDDDDDGTDDNWVGYCTASNVKRTSYNLTRALRR